MYHMNRVSPLLFLNTPTSDTFPFSKEFKKAFPSSASKVYPSGTLNSIPPIFWVSAALTIEIVLAAINRRNSVILFCSRIPPLIDSLPLIYNMLKALC